MQRSRSWGSTANCKWQAFTPDTNSQTRSPRTSRITPTGLPTRCCTCYAKRAWNGRLALRAIRRTYTAETFARCAHSDIPVGNDCGRTRILVGETDELFTYYLSRRFCRHWATHST